MSRLVGRKLQGTLGAHAASGLEAVPRYARRQKSLLGQGGGFWNYRWRSITDGGQSPPSVMFAIPITGAVCCSLNFRGLLLLNPLIAGLGGQVISNQRFCLRRRNLRSWEKPLCFRTGCIQASKRSSIFSVRTALHRRQFSPCSFDLVWPARAQALARAHPRIHKRTLCGCSYWESSRVELLAIQQSVKIFALSMLDIPPPRAPARANHNHFFFDSAMAGGLFHFEGGAELISPVRADSDSAASPTLAMETLPSQGRA